ncbi:hypothetical protein ACET3X_002074 [Alternaria dauci]|uniref:Rhodopsin domain-containing protein n=1 Tax=Alternaria dauci TaxID=48095 RepID=A0ABR3UZH7_9PLEO
MAGGTGGYGITWDNGSRQPMFLIVTGILLLLSTLAVALRLYCRVTFIRHVGLDDKFMVCAWVVAVSLGIQNGFVVGWGTGRHNADLDASIIMVPTFKHWYAYQIVYPWALWFVKASILALYYRIFTQTRFRYAVYAVGAFVTVQTIVVTFVNAFECGTKEPWRAWTPTFPQGCNDLPKTYFAMASVNIVTDIFILVMPMRAFGQLKLHRTKRFALLGVFMVGGVAVIASIVRLYALYIYAVTDDWPYDDIFILLLSQIEVNAAIISASAPALRPLLNKVLSSSSHDCSGPDYPASYAPGGPNSNMFCRTARTRSNRQMELYSLGGGNRTSKVPAGGTRNTSEESILGADGITKTVDMTIEEDYARDSVNGKQGETQGYEDAATSSYESSPSPESSTDENHVNISPRSQSELLTLARRLYPGKDEEDLARQAKDLALESDMEYALDEMSCSNVAFAKSSADVTNTLPTDAAVCMFSPIGLDPISGYAFMNIFDILSVPGIMFNCTRKNCKCVICPSDTRKTFLNLLYQTLRSVS